MVDIITTTKNKSYKYIKALALKKNRTAERAFTVEGIKSVHDAAASGINIKIIAVSEDFYNNEAFDYPKDAGLLVVRDELFDGLCDTKTPQGILAVLEMPDTSFGELDPDKLYVYCDNVRDPGNLGTIIRTADAAGLGCVLLSSDCADIFSPKTVRSSMGSFFNIPIKTNVGTDELVRLKEKGFTLFSGALRDDSEIYTEKDFTKPSVIIVGNEANGVSDEILSISEHIIIPIYGSAESLNAAVAGAVIMYEAVRQRHYGKGGARYR